MQTPSPELETVARLLGALRAADGPVKRVQFVTEASRAMRDLPDVDRRVLARWLYEHGAPIAAERIGQLPTHGATSEARNEVARALLTMDRHEVDRFAVELRDPGRYHQLVTASLAAAQPPPPPAPIAPPPPPPSTAAGVPPPEQPRVPVPRPAAVPTTVASPAWTPRLGRRDDADVFAHAAHPADSPRERWRRIDDIDGGRPLTTTETVQVLAAVPDGWQRRTALRRLTDAERIDARDAPARLVTAFARRSDRFAAAALLLRAGLGDVDAFGAHVDPRDVDRLRRRARR